MMHKGMLALTGAPAWPDAWRMFVQKGDVVAIKVCPVGGPKLSSDPAVLQKFCPRYIFDIDMMPVNGGRLPPVFGESPGSSTFRGCPVFPT